MSDDTEDLGDVGDDWAAAFAEQEDAQQGGQEAAGNGQADADAIEAMAFDEFSAGGNPVGPGGENLDMILDIPVTLSMEIGRTKIAIRNLLQLNQGSVVELDRLAGEPMDVLVNGTLIAHGEVVVVNEKFGIRLTDVVSAQERIKKLCYEGIRLAFLKTSLRNVFVALMSMVLLMHSSLLIAETQVAEVDKQVVTEGASSAPQSEKTETTKPAASSIAHSPADQILKTLVGLIVVLIFIFAIAWLAKNYMGFTSTSNSALKPIAAVSVGQKERVVLLQVGERQVLVGVAPGNVNMLHLLDKENEVDVSASAPKTLFAEKLKASMGKWEKS